RLEDGPGRGERDLVLARAAAHDHGDADPPRHGVVVVVSVEAAVSRPTKIVTTAFGFAGVPATGDWSSTMFSWLGSVVSCGTIFTRKPESFRVDTAVSLSSVVTGGTGFFVGPFETVRVMVEPLGAVVFAPGFSLRT